MKYLVYLIFITETLITHRLIAQDNQWLVRNQKYKDGWNNTVNQNNYSTSECSDTFTLSGVKHPCIICATGARNDIFVIFTDGYHYNSRNLTNTFSPAIGNENITTHKFINNYTEMIKFLYLTNIYEDDDDEKFVSISNNIPTSGIDGPFNITMTNQIIPVYANHDIIKEKDITIIVKKPENDTREKNYTLIINSFKSKLDGTIITNSAYWATSNLNDVGFASTGGTITNPNLTNNEFQLNFGISPYIYINLQPTSSMDSLFPSTPNVVKYEALFTLKDNTLPDPIIYTHTEDLRNSHDPNYVQVLSIYKYPNGDQYVLYHAQFKNTSFQAQGDLAISLEMPIGFIVTKETIEVVKWSTGGNHKNGTILISGQNIKFRFPPELSVITCDQTNDDKNSIGYVEFWVKVDKNIDLSDYSTSLEPKNRGTAFGSTHYDIHDFFDLSKNNFYKGNSRAELFNNPIYPKPFSNWFRNNYLLIIIFSIIFCCLIYIFFRNRKRKKNIINV